MAAATGNKKYIVLSAPLLSETELAGAFAVAETDRRHIAMLQLIADFERQANEVAQINVASHGLCAAANGAADVLGRLRDEMLRLRDKGFHTKT